MSRIILQPTITAQWQSLVQEAGHSRSFPLTEELESYLVFLLIRFMEKPEFIKSILALEFLEGAQNMPHQNREQLRDVGDKCLLISGLFPGRAQRKRVKISYFVNLGQSAYALLSDQSKKEIGELYKSLEAGFVSLMDVLHIIREMAGEANGLTPLQAEELWSDTSSEHALQVLQRYTHAKPFNPWHNNENFKH